MKVIKATQQMLETRTLVLGFQGENLRTQLRIDCAATFAEYPNATPALAIKPPSGETYPVFVERDGNEVVWNIVANNLLPKGDGELQLTFYKDNVIAKTYVGHIRVNRSLQIDGEMPDVVATWIENANRKLAEVDAQIVELEGMVDTATDAAERAEQSASTASTKAEQAAGSAATATEKATEATNAAGTATAKAAEAALSATQASNSAVSAADSERIAIAKAVDATTAATTATAKAEQATEAAQTATEKAGDASASATAAHASEINAAESADDALSAEVGANAAKRAAETSATQAGTSEQNAGTAAQTATQKAAEATQSATNAATFAGTATTKAEEAAASAQEASDAKTAVEQTAEQLADSLEQIEQNTQDIADHEQYAEATYAKKTDLSNLTSDLDLVQTSGTIVETEDAFPTFAEDVTAEIVPVQSGSGDPSPENIRPITGFDSVKVTRTGKNLLNNTLTTRTSNGTTFTVNADKSITVSGTPTALTRVPICVGQVWDGRALVIYSFGTMPTGTRVFARRIYNGVQNYPTINPQSTQPIGAEIYDIYLEVNTTFDGAEFTIFPQLELGSTVTTYEPYHGIQVELPFGQIVYGGTIDLTTGVLTVDRASATFNGSETWYWHASGVAYSAVEGGVITNATTQFNALTLCDKLKQSSWARRVNLDKSCGMFFGASFIFIKNSESITDAATAKTWLADNPITVVYPLATPHVYNMTPAQLLLLRDYNVLWANTGDITNLEYRAGSFVTKKTYDALKEATLIHNTASGTIASFPDGAEMPVDEVTVQINPVQDLHGYNNPWPGGGGENVLDPNLKFTAGTYFGGAFLSTQDGYNISFSGTPTESGNITTNLIAVSDAVVMPAGTYTSVGGIFSTYKPDGSWYTNRQTGTWTADSDFIVRQIYIQAVANTPISGSRFICLVKGSTAPTAWTPYSNICPITGFEGLTVTRTGKNLLDQSKCIAKKFVNSEGGIGNSDDWCASDYTQIKGGQTYTLSGYTATGWAACHAFYDNNKDFISTVYAIRSDTFTTPNNAAYVRLSIKSETPTVAQLELGTTSTAYEPYQGDTYHITFPSEAGTVYGGSLTIAEDGSGVLTVDRASVDLGTLNWTAHQTYGFYSGNIKATIKSPTGNAYQVNAICSNYKVVAQVNEAATNYSIACDTTGMLYVHNDDYSDAATFKTAMSGVQLVYELATPIEIALTASEIRTLLGENHLWHDANGDISVGYKANTKLYIDGKIAELVAQIVNS